MPAIAVTACTAVVDHWTGIEWPAVALVSPSGERRVLECSADWTPQQFAERLVALAAEHHLPIAAYPSAAMIVS